MHYTYYKYILQIKDILNITQGHYFAYLNTCSSWKNGSQINISQSSRNEFDSSTAKLAYHSLQGTNSILQLKKTDLTIIIVENAYIN